MTDRFLPLVSLPTGERKTGNPHPNEVMQHAVAGI